MKETIVGGIVAGLVSGSIMAGAIVLTRQDLSTVAIADAFPVRVTVVDQPTFPTRPDGSEEHPFFVRASGPDGSSADPIHVAQVGEFFVSQTNPIKISGAVYTWSCNVFMALDC